MSKDGRGVWKEGVWFFAQSFHESGNQPILKTCDAEMRHTLHWAHCFRTDGSLSFRSSSAGAASTSTADMPRAVLLCEMAQKGEEKCPAAGRETVTCANLRGAA